MFLSKSKNWFEIRHNRLSSILEPEYTSFRPCCAFYVRANGETIDEQKSLSILYPLRQQIEKDKNDKDNFTFCSSSSYSSSMAATFVEQKGQVKQALCSCPSCLEEFEIDGDHVPMILSCGHSLCRECVRMFMDPDMSIVCYECEKRSVRTNPNFNLIQMIQTIRCFYEQQKQKLL